MRMPSDSGLSPGILPRNLGRGTYQGTTLQPVERSPLSPPPMEFCQAFRIRYQSVVPHSKWFPRQNTQRYLASFPPQLGILIIGGKEEISPPRSITRSLAQRGFFDASCPFQEGGRHGQDRGSRPISVSSSRSRSRLRYNDSRPVTDQPPLSQKWPPLLRTRVLVTKTAASVTNTTDS
jgi:hypothetical protein